MNYRVSGKLASKRPSASLTPFIEAKVEPLFALPENLLDPSVCKRFKRRSAATVENKYHPNSYTGQRLRKEKFRRYMVGLITKPEVPEEGLDLNNDRSVNRYYYYIRNGIDTIHVGTIDDDTVSKIVAKVPDHLSTNFNASMESLMKEVRDDFILGIKKSIVEFVLTDPFTDEVCEKVIVIIN